MPVAPETASVPEERFKPAPKPTFEISPFESLPNIKNGIVAVEPVRRIVPAT